MATALQILELARARGEITQADFDAAKKQLATEPQKPAQQQPVVTQAQVARIVRREVSRRKYNKETDRIEGCLPYW